MRKDPKKMQLNVLVRNSVKRKLLKLTKTTGQTQTRMLEDMIEQRYRTEFDK